ncbi:MAG: MBL fold metallo-hydrolase [Patescibacteria group bacterium]
MSTRPQLTFASGVGSVTGANFLLETPAGSKILVDCGLIQGERVAMQENRKPFGYDASTIDVLIVTHAHLDHVGRIPKLVKEGFSGVIYSTPETRELAELVLSDAVGILTAEAAQQGLEPLYTREDLGGVFPLWKTIPYHQTFEPAKGVSVLLKDAGHILGSAMVEITGKGWKVEGLKGKQNDIKILFTGDLGNSPAPLLRDAEAIGEVDYMVMESVYGDRNHEDRESRLAKFEQVIKQTIDRGGTLVIPAFSIDRTQVFLYELNNLIEQKRIPSVPVFVDSPLAIKATMVYKSSKHLFNDAIQKQIDDGDDIFSFPHLEYTESQDESQQIERMKGAKIILAGSGMSVGGRVIRHEEHYLPDPRNTILLVGYQTTGSLGRNLADAGASGGSKVVTIHGRKIEVKANIETLLGYSAHKDSDHLVEFVTTATNKLKKIFVVMGEPKSSMFLTQRLNDELPVKAVVPERMVKYEL